MDEHDSRRLDRPEQRRENFAFGEGIDFLLKDEGRILQSISGGAPLPELLNRICSALDCEIGNVVSLVSLLHEETTDFAVIAENAKYFGLHTFCSIGIFAENHELLGTLEMYSCDPSLPSPRELALIERAGCLAAVAIEKDCNTAQRANSSDRGGLFGESGGFPTRHHN